MIVVLSVTTLLLAVALVVVVGLVLAAASRGEKLRVDERAMLMRAVIARGATETMAPGAEAKMLREMEMRAARPLVGRGLDEMEEARERLKTRAHLDGLVDSEGNAIVPTGYDG